MRNLSLTTTFNTGRWYTEKGQRISVFLVQYDGEKYWGMVDHDREITYLFEHFEVKNENLLRDYVMTCYDFAERISYSDAGIWFRMEAARFMPGHLFPPYTYLEYRP